MTGVLYGLARFCVRRRFVVLGVWLVAAIALIVISHRLGENTNDNLSLPGTDSQRATDTLAKSFPDQANGTSPIVLHASAGKLTEAKYADAVDQAADGRREGPARRLGDQPAHAPGRLRAEQGPDGPATCR